MRNHLRPVRLFGKSYYWHRAPGQPLQLVPVMPWPEPPPLTAEMLYEKTVRMMGAPLPWPEEAS